MVELSEQTVGHIRALFSESEVPDAIRLLGDLGPIVGRTDSPSSHRILFAALRLSGGTIDGLDRAIDLAKQDWRDLLVAANFADDIHTHEKWRPRRFDAATSDRWRNGVLPTGVDFGPGALVLWPAEQGGGGAQGSVIGLLGLEPEPRYRVRWRTGPERDMWQWQLRAAG
jgi:hypothetical protein